MLYINGKKGIKSLKFNIIVMMKTKLGVRIFSKIKYKVIILILSIFYVVFPSNSQVVKYKSCLSLPSIKYYNNKVKKHLQAVHNLV